MGLKPIVIGTLLLTGSTYSFAAAPAPTLLALQQIVPGFIGGGAPAQPKQDYFVRDIPLTYSENLNYVSGPVLDAFGNPAGSGHASTSISFDLPRGEFELYSDSVHPSAGPTVGNMTSGARIDYSDSFTVHSSTASYTNPAYITLRLNSEGTLSSLNGIDPSGNASFATTLVARNESSSLGLGTIFNTCDFGEGGECSPRNEATFSGGAFSTADIGVVNGGQDEIMVKIPLYEETSTVLFSISLIASSQQATTDFSNTSRLFVDVPGGSFTSESGIMSAVPEPETYAMFVAGLGLIGCIARRRKIS
jgi:hypothetical protein